MRLRETVGVVNSNSCARESERPEPMLMGDRTSFTDGFSIIKVMNTEQLENHTTAMKMGLLEIVYSGSCTSRALSSVLKVSVVLEEEVELDNLGDFVNAFIVLFGLLYALIMEYNKD